MSNYGEYIGGKLKQEHYLQANQIEVLQIGPDYAKLRMTVSQVTRNGFGFVHGGAMFGLADTAAGAAAFTDGRAYVTQNGNFHFISNVESGLVMAEATVLHRGKTVAVVEVKVTSEAGKLLGTGLYDMFAVKMPVGRSK